MGDIADAMFQQVTDCFYMGKPKNKYKRCRVCGKSGLLWAQHKSGKFWLIEKNGDWHTCEGNDNANRQ